MRVVEVRWYDAVFACDHDWEDGSVGCTRDYIVEVKLDRMFHVGPRGPRSEWDSIEVIIGTCYPTGCDETRLEEEARRIAEALERLVGREFSDIKELMREIVRVLVEEVGWSKEDARLSLKPTPPKEVIA